MVTDKQEVVFKVKGSQTEPYTVTFKKRGPTLTARCTCKAGMNRLICKHRTNLLKGNKKGIVSDNQNDLETVLSWLPGTDIEFLLDQVICVEAASKEAADELKNLKHQLGMAMYAGTIPIIEKRKREKRSRELIVEFEEGYAKGWCFAVGEAFKDQLDIKYTERIDEGTKRKVLCWTQGPFYAFGEGHIIYDTPKAYLQWSEALKHIKVACEVIRGTPNSLNENGEFVNGHVYFKLSEPNRNRTSLEPVGNYQITQNEFVDFLKTGKVPVPFEQLLDEKKKPRQQPL
jgi:hypothetical protein